MIVHREGYVLRTLGSAPLGDPCRHHDDLGVLLPYHAPEIDDSLGLRALRSDVPARCALRAPHVIGVDV